MVGSQIWDRDQKIKAGMSFCSWRGVGEVSRAEQMVRSEMSMLRAALVARGRWGSMDVEGGVRAV